MPFENQPWPLFLQQVDSTFVTPVHPRHPVKLAGVRLAVRWQATPTVQLHTDVLLQHIATLSFPTTGEKESIQFIPVAGFWFAGLFLNAAITVREGLGITARYQYSGFTKKDSPEFTEIPNHRLFFQLLLHRSFFHKNLNATALFSTELLGNRKSYGIGPGATRITVERLPAVPIFHLKLIFEIGDAEIFLYWFNFTNRLYSYRSLQPIPGWQFQYGVRWKFWD